MYKNQIAVIYLARKAQDNFIQPFINSYKNFNSGIPHDLIIVFKGYEEREDLENVRKKFAELQYTSIILPDTGFDIGSYNDCASQITHKYICCLNSYSKVLDNEWLRKLYYYIQDSDVGIVGATSSYEGVQTSLTFLQKAIWLYSYSTEPFLKPLIYKYLDFCLPSKSRSITRNLLSRLYKLHDDESRYQIWWRNLQKDPNIASLMTFPVFPNPHIRTTGFMIKRERFLELSPDSFSNKIDVCYFESGNHNFTRQILQNNLKALVVGKNGESYEFDQWAESNTFRSLNQENLLIADNHTEDYLRFSPERRASFSYISWGKKVPLPSDFPEII